MPTGPHSSNKDTKYLINMYVDIRSCFLVIKAQCEIKMTSKKTVKYDKI